jgi:ribosomal protein S3
MGSSAGFSTTVSGRLSGAAIQRELKVSSVGASSGSAAIAGKMECGLESR